MAINDAEYDAFNWQEEGDATGADDAASKTGDDEQKNKSDQAIVVDSFLIKHWAAVSNT